MKTLDLDTVQAFVLVADMASFTRAAEDLRVSQPTLSHHLKKLREAGVVDSERRGLWAYYYVIPDALKELSAWLS